MLGEVFRMSPDSRRNLAGLGGTGIGLATLGNVLVLRRGHLGSLGALSPEAQRGVAVGWGILSAVSSGASAYHGFRRNRSVGWAVAWGVLGALFPIIVPAVALAQGFARPAGRSALRGLRGHRR